MCGWPNASHAKNQIRRRPGTERIRRKDQPMSRQSYAYAAFAAALSTLLPPGSVSAAWEPTRPVEIVVPAGTGGGADQMARVLQGIVTKHSLMKQPMVVVNKAGGAGGEGFLDVKNS